MAKDLKFHCQSIILEYIHLDFHSLWTCWNFVLPQTGDNRAVYHHDEGPFPYAEMNCEGLDENFPGQ